MEGNQVEAALERRCVREGEYGSGVWHASHVAMQMVRWLAVAERVMWRGATPDETGGKWAEGNVKILL